MKQSFWKKHDRSSVSTCPVLPCISEIFHDNTEV